MVEFFDGDDVIYMVVVGHQSEVTVLDANPGPDVHLAGDWGMRDWYLFLPPPPGLPLCTGGCTLHQGCITCAANCDAALSAHGRCQDRSGSYQVVAHANYLVR